MKSLNKKIGAMALAGMVLVGGVAASGVSVHASSVGSYSNVYNFKNLYPGIEDGLGRHVLSKDDAFNIKVVEELVEELSKEQKVILLDVAKYRDKMERMLKNYHFSKEKHSLAVKLLEEAQHVGNINQFKLYLKGSRDSGYVIFKYHGYHYLFLLK